MAVVLRKCIVCETEFPSKNMRARFCKSACKSIHHRATKKPATLIEATQPIKPKEATPMKATQAPETPQVPMLFSFSESHYQTLCAHAKVQYLAHVEVPHINLSGAIVEFKSDNLPDGVEFYHVQRVAGWLPMEEGADQLRRSGVVGYVPTLPSIKVYDTPRGQFVSIYLRKPLKDQQADLEVIYNAIRADYEKDLDAQLEAEVDRQVQLVVDAKARSEREAAEQARLKLAQETRDELAASRMKLRAELIASGKLSAEGRAQ